MAVRTEPEPANTETSEGSETFVLGGSSKTNHKEKNMILKLIPFFKYTFLFDVI